MSIFNRKYINQVIKNTHRNLIKFLSINIPFLYKALHLLPSKKLIVCVDESTDHQGKIISIVSLTTVLLARYNKSKDIIRKQVTYKSSFFDFSMNLDINEFTQCGYYFHEPNNDLIKLIKLGGDVFIDVGANVGFFSMAASSVFNSVLSFEPTPNTLSRLRENIKYNEIKNIDIFDCALSEKQGVLKLHVNPLNSGGNSLNNFSSRMIEDSGRNDWESCDVDVKTLDTILLNKDSVISSLDLLKIDVEGHEVSALKGAINTLSKYKPLIYAEVSRSRDNMDRILQVIPKCYSPFYMQQFEIIDVGQGSVPLYVLFVPNDKVVEIRKKLKSS